MSDRSLLKAIVAMLPPGGDAALVTTELERIRDLTIDKLRSERDQMLEHDRHYRRVLELEHGLSIEGAERLRARAEGCKGRANLLSTLMRTTAWRLLELCVLAEQVGIGLGYTSEGTPHGLGISYLTAASEFVGKPIGPDRARTVLQRFAHIKVAAARFTGEGSLIANLGQIRLLAGNAGVVILD